MKSSRDSLGWKITAALLFLALVACAFSCALGAVYLHGAGFGKSASYFQCETCLELVERRQFQVARALYLQRELEGEDASYLERQQWQEDLDALLRELGQEQTNFRFQVKNFDGTQVLLSNLPEGEDLEGATQHRWYNWLVCTGDGVSLSDVGEGLYAYGSLGSVDDWLEFSPEQAASALSWTGDTETFMQAYARAYRDITGEELPQELYDQVLEELLDEELAGVQTMVLECGLPEQLEVQDEFWEDSQSFQTTKNLGPWAIAGAAASALGALACLIFLCAGAGHKRGVEGIHLNWQDRIWYDVYLCLAAGAVYLYLLMWDGFYYLTWWGNSFFWRMLQMDVMWILPGAALALAVILTTAARCKAGTLLRDTLIARCLRGVRWFVGSLPITWRLVVLYFCYLILAIALLELLWTDAYFVLLLVGGGVLLALCWWAVNFQRLRRAGEALAAGDLDYRVDTHRMPGDLRRLGEDLNNISGGMAHAVQEQMRSERFKAELITNVSHDLKTPLTSIINYVDLLKKTDIRDETARGYIQVLDDKSQRLKKLTEDLVEASKASTGTLPVNRERVGMVQLVSQALGEYEEKLEGRHLQVVTSLPEGEVYVNADGRHLWRVLDNLLSNCVKYAMEGTRVYLDLARGHGQVILSLKNVSRDALNIPPEQLMERFVRGDQSRTTEGSGLGLSIARSLTELQGGVFELSVDGDLFKATVSLPQMI